MGEMNGFISPTGCTKTLTFIREIPKICNICDVQLATSLRNLIRISRKSSSV